jgi:hypothetical protein
MKGKSLALSIVLAALVLAQAPAVEVPERNQNLPLVGRLPNQDKAPAFSSPQVTMAPNGDRVSHYPPYYHPEHSGR